MRLEPGYLVGMALHSIAAPRQIAQELFGLGLGRTVLWQILALLLVLSAALSVVVSMLLPAADGPPLLPVPSDPLMLSLFEGSVTVIAVFAIYWIGRAAGGTGRFEDAIMTMVWVTFVLLLVSVVTAVLVLFAPGLALMTLFAGQAMMFWLLSHFVAEMHEFRSVGLTFTAILLSLFAFVFVFSLVLTIIGVGAGTMGTV